MRFSSRMIALLLSLAMLLSAVPAIVFAEDLTDGHYTYTVNEDGETVSVTAYNGDETAVEIPSTLGGMSVTEIATNAFSSNTDIVSVVIPASVTKIQAMAFYNCSELAAVEISPYTLYVGYQAFQGTAFLSNHANGPVYIGRVLYGYAGIMPENTVINVKPATASISPYAFKDQKNLTEIYLPVGIRSIGSFAFMGCSNLLNLRVPPSVTDIGTSVFLNSGTNFTVNGVIGSTMDQYADQERLFFLHDETLDFPDGDMNRDKKTDSRDFRILMRMLLVDGVAIDEERLLSCDLVYDGMINSADIRALFRVHVGA